MLRFALPALIIFSLVTATAPGWMPEAAWSAGCASGPYAAGCAGPNGAVAVRKPAPYYHPPTYYHPPSKVTCVNGVYRAGCAGPNGAAVVHKAY